MNQPGKNSSGWAWLLPVCPTGNLLESKAGLQVHKSPFANCANMCKNGISISNHLTCTCAYVQPGPFIHQIGVDSLYRPIPIRIPHVFYNISKRQIHICFLHYIVQASMQASEVFLLTHLGQVNTNLIKHTCSLVLRPNAPAKLRFEPSNTSLLILICQNYGPQSSIRLVLTSTISNGQ